MLWHELKFVASYIFKVLSKAENTRLDAIAIA